MLQYIEGVNVWIDRITKCMSGQSYRLLVEALSCKSIDAVIWKALRGLKDQCRKCENVCMCVCVLGAMGEKAIP